MNAQVRSTSAPDFPAVPRDTLLVRQRDVLEAIVRGAPLRDILATLCRIVEDEASSEVRASILLVDNGRLRSGAAPSLPDHYNDAVDGIGIAAGVGTCADAAATGQVVVTCDFASDPAWDGLRHLPLGIGLQAAWSMPVTSADGTVLATFGTYFTEPRAPTQAERELVALLAQTAALAIQRDRADASVRESESALRATFERLDIAVNLSGVGFFYCDLPFDELVWDERVRAHFFMPHEGKVTIVDFYARLHPEDREVTRHAIETAIARQVPYDVVYRTVHPLTGEMNFIRALGGSTYAEDGTPIRFDGVTLDITAERTAQERLAGLLESEREHARLLGRVAEAAATIHACDSVDSVLRATADASRRIIGAQVATASLRRGHDGAPPASMTSFSNGAVPTNDAREWVVAPMIGHDGAEVGCVQVADPVNGRFSEADQAILRQFAQIAAVALENAQLYERLRDQDRRKDEFLATLAHELRNPLAPIRTGLHILRMTSDPEMAAKSRDVMERQLGHLVRLVDDLLDVSRITRGKVTLARQRLDLREVVDNALELARPLIDANGHALVLDVPAQPLLVDGDPTRLAQVLANLLTNAAKYTPPGGRLTLEVEPQPDTLVVRVRDNGIGIPPEMLGRVFDMFTQVDQSIDRAQGGLGIGLTLVRRLVALHGGTVEVASPGVGKGSTFTVRLPALQA